MDASEIKDYETLEAWLKNRPTSYAISIAYFNALRVMARVYVPQTYRESRHFDLTALKVLRCLVAAGSALDSPDAGVVLAADSAFVAASTVPGARAADRTAVDAATHAADAAASYAYAAEAARAAANSTFAASDAITFATLTEHPSLVGRAGAAAYEVTRTDALALQSNTNPLTLPLWHNAPPPDWFTTAETAMRTYWQTNNPTHWAFWQRWYDAAIAGRPLDWQLQHDIALIPDAIWQSGPGPVAKAIAQIEEAHNKGTTSQPLTDKLPTPTDRTRSIKFVVKQVTLLHELIEDEYEYLRGHNGGLATEQPLLDQQKAILQKLRDLVNHMLAALNGDNSPSTVLIVVNETLPAVVTETETLMNQGATPQVSAQIYSMAATIKVLTENGAPGDLATKIALANSSRNWFWSMFPKWRKG